MCLNRIPFCVSSPSIRGLDRGVFAMRSHWPVLPDWASLAASDLPDTVWPNLATLVGAACVVAAKKETRTAHARRSCHQTTFTSLVNQSQTQGDFYYLFVQERTQE